ncbi:hypothetical protein ACQP04_25030 [Pseudonocardia halophobica]|uniref:hypothetical protein n=1 Tax=Pseudonocardia halophobica TaxID=29401 RepID=UPI003D8E39EC
MPGNDAEAPRAEVWGDVVYLRRLRQSVVLGATSGLACFLLGTVLFGAVVAQPTLARTYALLVGLVVPARRGGPPLRRVLDDEDGADTRVDALLGYAAGGLGSDADIHARPGPRCAATGSTRCIAGPTSAASERLVLDLVVGLGMGLLGAVVFAAIGLVSGTDETAVIAPLTLLVALLRVPPVGVLTFLLAGVMAHDPRRADHAARDPGRHPSPSRCWRRWGCSAASGSSTSRCIRPCPAQSWRPSSGADRRRFVSLLTPFAARITAAAPFVFPVAAVQIAWFSRGRWGACSGSCRSSCCSPRSSASSPSSTGPPCIAARVLLDRLEGTDRRHPLLDAVPIIRSSTATASA